MRKSEIYIYIRYQISQNLVFAFSLFTIENFRPQKKKKMTQQTKIVPENEETYLTAEELCDPDNEIIFVQHPKEIETSKIEAELRRMEEHKRGKEIALTEVPGAKIYPVGFGNEAILVNKQVDKYYVATAKKH